MKFIESFMTFEFDDDKICRIEKVQQEGNHTHVMVCECIVYHQGKLCFIEAKSSIPQPSNKGNLTEFIHDIVQKFTQSVLFYHALHGKRFGEETSHQLSDCLLRQSMTVRHQFYLVLHGAKQEWLPTIQDTLCLALMPLLHAWNIFPHDVKVINEELAKDLHLIVDAYPVAERIRLSKEKANPMDVQKIGETWLLERNADVLQ